VFDRPLLRDPLIWIGVLLGLASIVQTIARHTDRDGSVAFVMDICLAVPGALIVVSVVGGSVREYKRARACRRIHRPRNGDRGR